MNFETFTILIEPREVHECINANTHTIILDAKDNILRYQCDIALPCSDETVCTLLAEWIMFPMGSLQYVLIRKIDNATYHSWVDRMQKALTTMRSYLNFRKDLEELGPLWKDNRLQLVKYLKNKYQYGLKETKEMVDLYYISTDSN